MGKTLLELDQAYVWHPFTQMQTCDDPIVIDRAEGVYLYSEKNSYLDAISSWWVNLHGHSHPYIVKALQDQLISLEHVMFAGFTHAPAIHLASRLMPLMPGNMSKVFYSDNGSTAVETALKMALQYWFNQNIPKKKVVCFNDSYHGDTFGAMAAAGKNAFSRPFWSHLFQVETINTPFPGKEEVSIKQLNAILNREDVACFIFEPLILGAGGMRIYSASGLSALLQLCQENQVLTIADEVMTGFGRTGSLFASDQVEGKPDIVCVSKGLTGGFLPLGATFCTEPIFNAFLSDRYDKALLHGHSYTANPLACSSALASLDLLLTKECSEKRAMIGSSHEHFCQKWAHSLVLKRCESLGTILALEFHKPRPDLYRYFISHGVLLRPLGNVLYVLPPYCIAHEELNRIYHLIEGVL